MHDNTQTTPGGTRSCASVTPTTSHGGAGVSNNTDAGDRVPPTTPLGTPCAKSWTRDWIATVEAKETECDHRICGARLMSGNPCPLVSTHSSGRCRYHGGFDLTGAPEGNRNAVLHNLYSRRLMPCGRHCPAWQSCPLGGGAKDQGASVIKLDQVDRPTCPYEQTEYNTAVSDGLRRITAKYALGYARHVIHQLALAQVMVTRAGLALREAEFVKVTVITGEKYHLTTPKVAPALTAYEKLVRTHRLLLNDFERIYATEYPPNNHHEQFTDRIKTDTPLDPDTQAEHYQSMNPNPPVPRHPTSIPTGRSTESAPSIPTGRSAEPQASPSDSAHPQVRPEDPWVQLPTGRLRRSEYMRQLNEMMGRNPTQESTETDGLPPP